MSVEIYMKIANYSHLHVFIAPDELVPPSQPRCRRCYRPYCVAQVKMT